MSYTYIMCGSWYSEYHDNKAFSKFNSTLSLKLARCSVKPVTLVTLLTYQVDQPYKGAEYIYSSIAYNNWRELDEDILELFCLFSLLNILIHASVEIY